MGRCCCYIQSSTRRRGNQPVTDSLGLDLNFRMGSILTFDLLQEQLTSVSYSIIFDACFGKGGAEELLKRTKSGKLEITPGELDGQLIRPYSNTDPYSYVSESF